MTAVKGCHVCRPPQASPGSYHLSAHVSPHEASAGLLIHPKVHSVVVLGRPLDGILFTQVTRAMRYVGMGGEGMEHGRQVACVARKLRRAGVAG